jgi:predicted transporter
MGTLIGDIVVSVIVIVACVRWWFTAIKYTYKKYIIFLGICFFVSVAAYNIGKSLNISSLMVVSAAAFLGYVYFLIKALLAQRRARNKQPHN